MKTTLTTLLIGCMAQLCIAQNAQVTIGKYTDCLRPGGICSFQSSGNSKNSQNANATFISINDGKTLLRIHRAKITKDEEVRLLGTEITEENKHNLSFTMGASLPLTPTVKGMTSSKTSRQLDILAKGNYKTTITEKYIDITIIE